MLDGRNEVLRTRFTGQRRNVIRKAGNGELSETPLFQCNNSPIPGSAAEWIPNLITARIATGGRSG